MTMTTTTLTGTSSAAAKEPSGDSRLCSYMGVTTIITATVLIFTLHTVIYVQQGWGGWESKSASTIDIRPISTTTLSTSSSSPISTLETIPKNHHSEHLRASNTKNNNNNTDNADNHNYDETPNTESEKPKKVFPLLLDSVLEAHEAMLEKLRHDYGDEYFEKIFQRNQTSDDNNNETEKPSDGGLTEPKLEMEYLPFRPFGPKDLYYTEHWDEEKKEDFQQRARAEYFHSVSNLQRKMMIKILRAHSTTESNDHNDDENAKTYVWATGGHSAAAGHGNLFHESYTKVMEATSAGVFEASGLELEARNYAMGGTSSVPEMSMCFSEIYGDDVDIFSWDFGMLEARDYLAGRLLHYAVRGFLSNHQNKVVPAFVGLQEMSHARTAMMEELHNAFRDPDESTNGLALFLRDENYWKDMKDELPDNADLTTEQINQLPEFIRHFKCNGAIEKGLPYCDDTKYSQEICPKRIGQASWHPGWKYNALVGNSMALFLTEILVDAVREIEATLQSDKGITSPEILLSNLMEEEDGHRERLIHALDSQLPLSYDKVFWYNNTSDDWKLYQEEEALGIESGSQTFRDRWAQLDRKALFFGPSLCHTARIPAQTRFFGHLTNQPEMTGKQAVFGTETYFTGIEEQDWHERNKAMNASDPETPHQMQLVWLRGKEREETCGDVLAKPDYHDNFMAEDTEGWTFLEFPNEAEKEAYGYQQHRDQYKGILIIVPKHCGFGKCETGYLASEQYNEGKWTVKVNGVSVKAMTMIGHEAILLEHEDGIYFDPNDNGTYKLEIKVDEPDSFVKISAFVLY